MSKASATLVQISLENALSAAPSILVEARRGTTPRHCGKIFMPDVYSSLVVES